MYRAHAYHPFAFATLHAHIFEKLQYVYNSLFAHCHGEGFGTFSGKT